MTHPCRVGVKSMRQFIGRFRGRSSAAVDGSQKPGLRQRSRFRVRPPRTNPLTAERGQLYHPAAMIQRAARVAAQKVLLAVVAAATLSGCDGRPQGSATPAASTAPAGKTEPTVASLSPAAT